MSQEILDKLNAIIDRQIEHAERTNEQMAHLDKKLDLHIQKTEYELQKINSLDEEQNEQLALHIEGVKTLKALYENHREESHRRLDALEEPRKVLATIKRWLIGVGALAGAVVAILKFFEYI